MKEMYVPEIYGGKSADEIGKEIRGVMNEINNKSDSDYSDVIKSEMVDIVEASRQVLPEPEEVLPTPQQNIPVAYDDLEGMFEKANMTDEEKAQMVQFFSFARKLPRAERRRIFKQIAKELKLSNDDREKYWLVFQKRPAPRTRGYNKAYIKSVLSAVKKMTQRGLEQKQIEENLKEILPTQTAE